MNRKKKSWMNNNAFLIAFSVAAALLCWVVVAMTNPSDYRQPFYNITVDAEPQADALISLGLNTIEMSPVTVEAMVYGERLDVIRLTSEDLAATIDIPANLSSAGTYDLTLTQIKKLSDGIRVEYMPSQVRVRVDRLVQDTFDVEPVISGLSVPEGYILDEKIMVTPQRITVSGPQVELDKIARCVIRADFTNPLESTFANEFPILLLDAQGNEINPDMRHLTLSNNSAQLIVTVLKEKELPLIVEFTNVPRAFPLEELSYSMSRHEVMIAGPTDMVNRYQEQIIGFIDLRQVNSGARSFTFDVEMPSSQIINLDGVTQVTLTFNASGWDESVFTVTDILVVNPPARYDVQLLSETIYDVVITGEKEILETITSDDIIAEVDLSERELVPGQQKYPVKISVPGKGLVWATGEYSVVVQVI